MVVAWILLGIIGFLLLLLFLVLFFPVSYRVDGMKSSETMKVAARVKWLFGFVRVIFEYPDPAEPKIKILFFTLGNRKKKQNSRKKKTKNTEPAPSDSAEKDEAEVPEGSVVNDTQAEQPQPVSAAETAEIAPAENTDSDPVNDHKKEKEKKKEQKIPVSERLEKLKEEAAFFISLWEQDSTKAFVKELLGRLLKILKKFFPRSVKGKIHFGAASPDITGYAMAAYSVGRTMFPKKLKLSFEPEFNEEILEGELHIKGHITVIVLVWNGLKIILDRRLHRLLKELKKHRNSQN